MRAIIAVALVGLATGSVEAQETPEAEPSAETEDESTPPTSDAAASTAVALARALDERLTVWHRGKRRVHVGHCRSARGGCRARLVAFALLITEVGFREGVDPFLLAAMAIRESGMNPFAEGGAGERGLVQLHPRGVGSRVRFVQNERHRQRCERRDGACQDEVLEAGARLIAAAVQTCGSVVEGLGRYNSGHCQETGYGRRVLRERERLLELAKRSVRARQAALLD